MKDPQTVAGEITFKIFSERVKSKFTNPDFFDVDYLNDLYWAFKEGVKGYKWELDEWIEFMFSEWNLDTHDTMLKTQSNLVLEHLKK